MIGYSVRLGRFSIPVTPAFVLYAFALCASAATLYLVGPLLQLTYASWAEYYRMLGELLRIWGTAFGIIFCLVLLYLALRGLITGSLKSLFLVVSRLETILLLLFAANILWAGIGLLNGAPVSFIVGDTFRGLFIPAIYFVVKKSVSSEEHALFLARFIIFGETALLFVLAATGWVPFSFAGRIFVAVVFLSLLIEEMNSWHRFWYSVLLLFGIFLILTTEAVRGSIIVFVASILLNYYFRLRDIKIGVVVFAFVLPMLLLFQASEIFDIGLSKQVGIAEQRFSGAIRGKREYYGLDESLFQRIGETIDVGRTFAGQSPVYVLTGFGNGAQLVNQLITPSERWVYKSNVKHNLYVTAVAILYRNGLLGLALYGMLVLYVVRSLRLLRQYRHIARNYRKYIYLKTLCVYQLSAILISFVSYWYVGNIVVAFTLPLIEILRRDLVHTIRRQDATS